jgi:hypothetical protein
MGLAHRQGKRAQIIAIERQNVEGIELHLVIVLAGMRRVEIGDAVNAEDDGFAIDDELLVFVLQRGLNDPPSVMLAEAARLTASTYAGSSILVLARAR